MVVLVIIGILASLSVPRFRRDRVTREGFEFANEIARGFQHARYQAIAERLPIRAFVFSDRVEFRSAVPGATPGATLSTSAYKTIEFNTLGGATVVGAATPAIYVYLRNDNQGVATLEQSFRIGVAPLTASTVLDEVW